ncbi:hypothetical protein F5882DRAFT_509874 [Hyaloscypha sp. PMI_1271]|nr:hypothetical protein F5882DRAFT_509874 [Hyaloscypha sp. PMI_1271]
MTNKAGNPLDVAQLQEQLEEALKAQKQLQRQLDASRPTGPEKPKCYFLETIPIEVRNHIYEYLLVNPDLCSPAIFPASAYHEQIDRYYLSPSILGTCRQINDEATPILYERNTFIVGFNRGCCPYSPISRIEGEIYGYTDLFQRPGFKKVKQWKAILSVNKEDGFGAPIYDFVTFCRTISDNLPRSLKVWIMPKGYIWDTEVQLRNHYDVTVVLQPLSLLRNISEIHLGEMPIDELSAFRPVLHQSTSSPHDFPAQWLENMKALVKSDAPLACVWKMYQKLLNYAQSFERNDQFRENMEPIWGSGAWYAKRKAMGASWSWRTWNREWGGLNQPENPFLLSPAHPVEEGLLLGNVGSEKNDIELFLNARATVLGYLEPQYQRIANASLQRAEFVKAEKKRGGALFGPSLLEIYEGKPPCTRALLLLEDYAQSFVRDVPLATRINIRERQTKFECAYAFLERETLLKRLSSILANDNLKITGSDKFFELFKLAVDNMDKQYLVIRKARKELFDCDDDTYERVIDPELWRCDEMVNWEREEPDMETEYLRRSQRPQSPQPSLHEPRSDSEDSDSNFDADNLGDSSTQVVAPITSEDEDDSSENGQGEDTSASETEEA